MSVQLVIASERGFRSVRGESSPALGQQQWIRISGLPVAVMMAVLIGANADASPLTAAPVVTTGENLTASIHHLGTGNAAFAGAPAIQAAQAQAMALTSELAVVSKLSARQLAGQRVIYSYSGYRPPQSLLSLIAHGEAGGVIFFGANYQSTSQFMTAISELDQASASPTNPARGYPLLLMTDQEGGEIRRLPGAPDESEKWIGSRANAADRAYQARQAGAGAAATLRGYGLNVNLAPVLDVYRAAGDFDDQYQRSYSTNPKVVAALGAEFIAAQQALGVAAAAKHFPGLGAATAGQNTDDVPVTINLSRASLHAVDEYPYAAAIRGGVKLVMVSWAIYPQLGSTRPAGLSSAIVQGELRTRLGFQGITITDAIGAGALARYGSVQNRTLLAAEAGMQLMLASDQSPNQGVACMNALASGYQDGSLSKESFEATVMQILALRSGLPAK